MKLNRLILAALAGAPLFVFGAPGDVNLPYKNANDTAFVTNILPKTPNAVFSTDANGIPILVPGGGGGGTPGGPFTSVQYNNSGVFGGNSGFTSDTSGNVDVLTLLASGNVTVTQNISGNSLIKNQNTNSVGSTTYESFNDVNASAQVQVWGQSAGSLGATNFGVSRSNLALFIANNSPLSGLGIGTITGVPVIIGTDNLPALSINGTTQVITFNNAFALPNGSTATTQTVGDNTTKVATDAFVIANATGGSGVSSVTGTSNQVTASPTTGSVIVGLPNSVTVNTSLGVGANPTTGDLTDFTEPTSGIGTITVSATSGTVAGVSTTFTRTFRVNDTITATTSSGSETHTISAIASDTSMTTDAWTGNASTVAYTLVGGLRWGLLGGGELYVGTPVGSANRPMNVVPIYTFTTGASAIGAVFQPTVNQITNSTTQAIQAINALAIIGASNTQNWTAAIGSAIGARLGFSIASGATGTISNASGAHFTFANGNSATVTNAYGADIAAGTQTSGGTTTNMIGLAIANQTVGGTSNVNLLLGTATAPTGNYSIYDASTYGWLDSGGLTITPFSTAGIVTNNSSGVLATSTAIPNGTTATTQTVGDNTTKVATDAFVIANSGSGTVTTSGSPASTYLSYFTGSTAISGNAGATEDTSGNFVLNSLSTTGKISSSAAAAATPGFAVANSTTLYGQGLLLFGTNSSTNATFFLESQTSTGTSNFAALEGTGSQSAGSLLSTYTTDQSGVDTGAFFTTGGAAIHKSLYVGTGLTIASMTTAGILTNNTSGVLASLSNASSPSSTLLGLLGSGTPSSSNFLRGDGSWAAPAGSGTVTTSGSPASTYLSYFTGSTVISGNAGATEDTSGNLGVASLVSQGSITGQSSGTTGWNIAAAGSAPGELLLSATGTSTSVPGSFGFNGRSSDGSVNIFPFGMSGTTAAGSVAITYTTPATSATTGALTVTGGLGITGAGYFASGARTSGVAPYFQITTPADTGITTATEAKGLNIIGATRSWATTGTLALQEEDFFGAPTYAAASASNVITLGATVSIGGPPANGTNTTVTTPTDLLVTYNALGASQTGSLGQGLILQNATAGLTGAPQISPSLVFSGQGFNTGGSAAVLDEMRIYAAPTSSTSAAATATAKFDLSTNGGSSWTTILTLNGNTSCVFSTGLNASALAATNGITAGSSILSSSATAGIGYTTGAGGTVTQATSRSTGVTLNTATGTITGNGASLAASTAVSFTVTDSAYAAIDIPVLSLQSGTSTTHCWVSSSAAGSFVITEFNENLITADTTAPVISFAKVKVSNN